MNLYIFYLFTLDKRKYFPYNAVNKTNKGAEMELRNLTLEQLKELKAEIEKLIEEKETQKDEYTFYFEATEEARKGYPYVAKLSLKDNRIVREFKDLNRDYAGKEVIVSGDYKAREGDIIEEQYEASWKNKYRKYSVIYKGEKLVFEDIKSDEFNVKVRPVILPYLKGEKTLEELIDELKDNIEYYKEF